MPRFHRMTVSTVDRLTDDAAAITFAVPKELQEEFTFRPGQSLLVRRYVGGHEERRHYSICAPAGDPPRIGVRTVEDGAVSRWLVNDVRPGDEVDVAAPTGTFTPDLAEDAHHALVVAGSGITPALSITASALRNQSSTVTLIYGNRRADTVMFADELADIKDRHADRLNLVHVLSREPRATDIGTGHIDGAKLDRLRPVIGEPDHWWLCGPYEMVRDLRKHLIANGVPTERIHRELFYVGDDPPPQSTHPEAPDVSARARLTVRMNGRVAAVDVPMDDTLLAGAGRRIGDLPFACKGGVCGTCRARVVDGSVDMRRNFALDDEEVAAGFVLTCQSVPKTSRIEIDYDA